MTLRVKFLLILIALATSASVAFGISSYISTADRLHAEVDQSLDDASHHVLDDLARGEYGTLSTAPLPDEVPASPSEPTSTLTPTVTPTVPPASPGDDDGDPSTTDARRPIAFDGVLVQLLHADGSLRYSTTPKTILPVGSIDRGVASGAALAEQFHTIRFHGESFRVLATPITDEQGGAIEVGRSLAETDRILAAFRNRTLIIMLVVTAAAGLIGWLLALQVTKRIEHLTLTAESVAKTGRLDIEVSETGRDETARLAGAFNQMLNTLAASKDAQQRLVQDASHELRTPLTSVRTNLSLLRRFEQLDSTQRQEVLDDLDGESRELTKLVNELVELATDQRDEEPEDDVPLGDITERVAARARRRTGRSINVTTDQTIVNARPQAIERAVSNLIDNATKFADTEEPIEVVQHNGVIEVRDRGPGFQNGDITRVFDRFYRAVDMRSRPGSGLGLSIVREIAESHGGRAYAANRTGGGAVVGISLPTLANRDSYDSFDGFGD